MDISIMEDGGCYTVNLHSEHAVNYTKANHNIPCHMVLTEDMFLVDTQEEIQNYVTDVLSHNLTVSLNNSQIMLNEEKVLIYKD